MSMAISLPHIEKVQRSVALLPWSHNMLLLNKGLDDDATLYYATKTVEKGWNRDLLLNAIKLNMYETQAKAITRFLMELGNGFTFIGNQHVLEYNGKSTKREITESPC